MCIIDWQGIKFSHNTQVLEVQVKGAWPDHFFDHPTYRNFFEISVPINGSNFSHSHPEIWHSKIGHLQRNYQKCVTQLTSVVTSNHTHETINKKRGIFSYYFKTRYKPVFFSLWPSFLIRLNSGFVPFLWN